ncbi:tail assembly protein [Teredinibacter purpureus]|uniref:hypothetical protein n=1 Tax=Teredinibacter purpureus TaxID=2731756 RepID=UPI0005F766BD|nr:hypothetical protein [Teredinibacter purpureus]
MIKVFFYGGLAKLVEGAVHVIDVKAPLDAVLFLESVLPGFKKEFRAGRYFLALEKDALPITENCLRLGFGGQSQLHILPQVQGRKAGYDAGAMAPNASAYEDREGDLSALFSGALNTTEQGVCRPLIYGRVRDAGSAVISAGINSEQVSYSG